MLLTLTILASLCITAQNIDDAADAGDLEGDERPTIALLDDAVVERAKDLVLAVLNGEPSIEEILDASTVGVFYASHGHEWAASVAKLAGPKVANRIRELAAGQASPPATIGGGAPAEPPAVEDADPVAVC